MDASLIHSGLPNYREINIVSLAKVSGCFNKLSSLFSGKVKGNGECKHYLIDKNKATGQKSLNPIILFLFFFQCYSISRKKSQTYSVFRPLRPLNMRPCSPVNLFPVNSSSETPTAPSNAPSRMSLNLLLLRLLQAKHTHTVLHVHRSSLCFTLELRATWAAQLWY